MVRIRSPTQNNLMYKTFSDWNIISVAFLIEIYRLRRRN